VSARLLSARALGPVALLLALAACAPDDQGSNPDPEQIDSTAAPALGACRSLTPADVKHPSNATETVPCTESHTAQTFAVGPIPADLTDAAYDDRRLGEFAYTTCSLAFEKFLGADESLVMRTILSWAWFRPSEKAWAAGARWYRCDVVGGGESSKEYVGLPTTAKGILAPRPDRWMICADGPTVTDSEKVACTEPHSWRAVTTIKLGEPGDPYPGDEAVQDRTSKFCSESVGAWLSYPVNYDFGYTWFHEGEWAAGNRRSVCWAKTDQ